MCFTFAIEITMLPLTLRPTKAVAIIIWTTTIVTVFVGVVFGGLEILSILGAFVALCGMVLSMIFFDTEQADNLSQGFCPLLQESDLSRSQLFYLNTDLYLMRLGMSLFLVGLFFE